MNTSSRNIKGYRIWVELSSGDESDWRAAFEIFGRAFFNDPFYCYRYPDPEKRRIFMKKYFEYKYVSCFNNGKGLLSLIKIAKSEKEHTIVGAMSASIKRDDKESARHINEIKSIDEEGWKKYTQGDKWENENIHAKMIKVAESLGTIPICGMFGAIDIEYMDLGIGNEIMKEAQKLIRDEIYRREKLLRKPNPKPPLPFALCNHARSRKFSRIGGAIELAQLRRNYTGEGSEALRYCWIITPPDQDPSWIETIRKAFNYQSISNL